MSSSCSGPGPEMPADPDTWEAQLEKLQVMVRQASLEDRCRLRRTIEIIMRARKTVLETRQIVQLRRGSREPGTGPTEAAWQDPPHRCQQWSSIRDPARQPV